MSSQKEDGLAGIVELLVRSFVQIQDFLSSCKEVLESEEGNSSGVFALEFERKYLTRLIQSLEFFNQTLETSTRDYESICIHLLKVNPTVMSDVLMLWGLEERGCDLMEMYTRYAELQSETKSEERAIFKLFEEHGYSLDGLRQIGQDNAKDKKFERMLNEFTPTTFN